MLTHGYEKKDVTRGLFRKGFCLGGVRWKDGVDEVCVGSEEVLSGGVRRKTEDEKAKFWPE